MWVIDELFQNNLITLCTKMRIAIREKREEMREKYLKYLKYYRYEIRICAPRINVNREIITTNSSITKLKARVAWSTLACGGRTSNVCRSI